MKEMRICLLAILIGFVGGSGAATDEEVRKPAAKSSFEKLKAGNRRYTDTAAVDPHHFSIRRTEVSQGQHPFAVILGCADSRVPPEILFNQGLGDLFVIRIAGNIVDDAVLGSIEYAVEHLGSRLVVVLGHERCGAVAATLGHGELPGHIGSLTAAIQPAIAKLNPTDGDSPTLDESVRANVEHVVEQLKSSGPILSELVEEGELMIVGARYDLDDGVVEYFASAKPAEEEGSEKEGE